MVRKIVGNMPNAHRRFLLSFEQGEPDWDLLGLTGAPDLPAVRWRQHNLDSLSKTRRQRLVDHLARVLDA